MFTGIIESVGEVVSVEKDGSNVEFGIRSEISGQLHVDQSVSHEGVCLTVTSCDQNEHTVTAILETLEKSNLGKWKVGSRVNLERCMLNNGRFDGHIVQGHVDRVGEVQSIEEKDGSWVLRIEHGPSKEQTVEKGSVTLNGISLTCFDSTHTGFSVAIIPYTYENTTIRDLSEGDNVNIEFDIIGKYVRKMLERD